MIGSFRSDLASPHFPIPGSVFYVSSSAPNASDSNRGTTPDSPLATIVGALARCTANKGDAVFCLPGHSESYSVVTDWAVAGTSIIGLGEGDDTPKIRLLVISSYASVVSHNMSVENIHFVADVTNTFIGLSVGTGAVQSNGFIGRRLRFSEGDGTWGTISQFVFVRTSNDAVISDCSATSSATASKAVSLSTCDRARVTNCNLSITGASGGVINVAASNQWLVDGCIVEQKSTAASTRFAIAASSGNGFIVWNFVSTASSAGLAQSIDPGTGWCTENYATDGVNLHGVVFPTTAST